MREISRFHAGEYLPAVGLHVHCYHNLMVDLTPDAWKRVRAARGVIDRVLERGEVVYGINTGFGAFSHVIIPPDKLSELQENLIRSHACGVGKRLPVHRARMLFALRLNVLARGRSGIDPDTLSHLLKAFNLGLVAEVPEQGSVGASGDLAPLAHLALAFLGEGNMWHPRQQQWLPASDVLRDYGMQPRKLGAKEGLALINGTQFITSLTTEALLRAENLLCVADVCAALSTEALLGTQTAFRPLIHHERPHRGQLVCAKRVWILLNDSEIAESHRNCGKVQDSYSLRCVPQVHGVVHDTIQFVRGILETEINSATDNPMIFGESEEIISGGNFHGEYPAKAADFLAIGVHELANISERRVERLVNASLSGLPSFLVADGGVNSGFMMIHVTAAALTSENKTLVHPASSDTISTSSAQEDHVSMGAWAARKVLRVVENTERVLAIELLAACQGLTHRLPLKPSRALQAVYELVRSRVAPLTTDRYMGPDLNAATELVKSGAVWAAVKPFLRAYDKPLDGVDSV